MEKLTPNSKRERAKKITCIVLVIVAVLGLGGLAGYAIGQQNKDKEVAKVRDEVTHQPAEQHEDKNKEERPAHEQAPAKVSTDLTCNADELSLSIAPAEEGESAGSRNYEIALENTSGRICTLEGYPGVSLVNENGNQIGDPADRVEDAEMTAVTLNPGASAQSAVTMPNSDNFPAGECKDGATKLRVYPPNDTGYLSVATDMNTWCKGFNVAPVVAVE